MLSTLQTTRPLFSSFLRIRSLATSPSNPELQQARSELESTLQELSADLRDLAESVGAIEQDPYRYGVELDEVQRRRRLVEDVGAEIENMRQELEKPVTVTATTSTSASLSVNTGGEGGRGGVAAALPSPSHFDNLLSPAPSAADGRGDDYYAALEQQRQLELLQEQDEQLDGVFRTVGNLRQQADDMGRELEEQAVMLDDMDTLADRVGGKLQHGVKRLTHIVRKNEGKQAKQCTSFWSPIYIASYKDWKETKTANFPKRNRYNVLLLHRSVDLRAHTIINPGDRSVI